MLMKKRAPRVNKQIKAVMEKGTGIIENISSTGGFFKYHITRIYTIYCIQRPVCIADNRGYHA